MKFLRLAMILGCLASSVLCYATPEILKQFKGIYNVPNIDCAFCHQGKPPKRNAYGKAVEEALNQTNDGVLTKAVLTPSETLDSDGDGISNIEEINAGTNPGDPASKPEKKATNASPNTPKAAGSEIVPKHSFHPAIVHFPIALLAVAAFLEVWGKRTKRDSFHSASVINLGLGLLSSIGAIITGVAAWLRLGYSIEGDLLIHLLLASASVLVGILAYVQREKPAYLPFIGVSGLLVMAAGHFGGNLVFG